MAGDSSEVTPREGEQALLVIYKLLNFYFSNSSPSFVASKLPPTSVKRLTSSDSTTILYLAYGSNLSAETFKGARGIQPLSAVNVHVPSLDLTFDLSGIPYTEPCFANTRYRDENRSPPPPSANDYHKDRWHKGLIGVVYEVTPEDYRTIIATEGGGVSYQDVVVPCYALPSGRKTVDPIPSGAPFKAHTLLQPRDSDSLPQGTTGGKIQRPDPSYAQASARYLKLITDGAEEHDLPAEYLTYLYDIRPYTITTFRQRVGQAVFLALWGPILGLIFGLSKVFADEEGKIPGWLATMFAWVFWAVWGSYDVGFKNVFGDGERTIGDETDDETGGERRWDEKV